MESEVSSPERSSHGGGGGEGISEYEQQRLSRIRENNAKLEALGLRHLASSLRGPLPNPWQPREEGRAKNKGKKRKGEGGIGADGEEDEEYRPSDDDVGEDDEDGESSSTSSDEDDIRRSSSSRRKGKKKTSSNVAKVRKGLYLKQSDDIDDDAALQQAIALSLGGASDELAATSDRASQNFGTSVADAIASKKKGSRMALQETSRRRKSRKVINSRVQLTEDEVVAYFFSFDEAGKGHIMLRDLQRMVIAHDFNWTEMEMAHMIHSFDSGGHGKLSLENFRKIVSRCNMMQEPGKC